MKLKLISTKVLPGIVSASGIEFYNDKFYIISDDSAWLFILDKKLSLVEKIPLLKKKKLTEERIPKKHKPDLEAMTFATIRGENILFIFGSGSKLKKREKLFVVFPERNHVVQEFSLAELYNTMFGKDRKDTTLNIEAAAANDNEFFLVHRGNISGRNMTWNFDLEPFADFVMKKKRKHPLSGFRVYDLPQFKKLTAGFSGAAMLGKKRILFSASVEDTESVIDDGSILGSFIGIMNTEKSEYTCELLRKNNRIQKLKVESVCLKKSQGKVHTIYAVTDSDGGNSKLLEIELNE